MNKKIYVWIFLNENLGEKPKLRELIKLDYTYTMECSIMLSEIFCSNGEMLVVWGGVQNVVHKIECTVWSQFCEIYVLWGKKNQGGQTTSCWQWSCICFETELFKFSSLILLIFFYLIWYFQLYFDLLWYLQLSSAVKMCYFPINFFYMKIRS